jgi:hypothetical protein
VPALAAASTPPASTGVIMAVVSVPFL